MLLPPRKVLSEAKSFLETGGDEFTIIIERNSSTEMDHLSDTIQREVDKFNEYGERAYKLAISVGYARFGTETIQTVDKLIEAVDEQMYQMMERKFTPDSFPRRS